MRMRILSISIGALLAAITFDASYAASPSSKNACINGIGLCDHGSRNKGSSAGSNNGGGEGSEGCGGGQSSRKGSNRKGKSGNSEGSGS